MLLFIIATLFLLITTLYFTVGLYFSKLLKIIENRLLFLTNVTLSDTFFLIASILSYNCDLHFHNVTLFLEIMNLFVIISI